MIAELCFEQSDLAGLKQKLLASDIEQCAVLFISATNRRNGETRLLVREIEYPDANSYQIQSARAAQLSPKFVAYVAKRAKQQGLGLVFVHSHPGDLAPVFSPIDDEGERKLSSFLQARGVLEPHAALVFGTQGLRCRLLNEDQEIRVISLGTHRVVEFDQNDVTRLDKPIIFDRQVRALGVAGQKRLEMLRVAIVGLGGTGSIAAQQLVHLGVKKFILVDPDLIEDTNLNRVVGATIDDIGRKKVAIAKRYIEGFRSGSVVRDVDGDVVHDCVARELIDADLILCCTDSHGSRSVVQQVAYQYMIPCIDMGSIITQANGEITGIFGRVQLLSPGLPCLWCSNLLDPNQIRRDIANEAERSLDPYIVGGGEPAPAVIALNGTVVSLAVTMLLGFVTGAPFDSRHLIYDAAASTLRSVSVKAADCCFICSKSGAMGWGDRRPLFARSD